MVLEVLTSPHRRSQNPFSPFSPSFRKQVQGREEFGSWSTLLQRHRFLLTTLVLLAFLCAVYLYFAVTLGAAHGSCSEMTGANKALCHLEHAKSSISHAGAARTRTPSVTNYDVHSPTWGDAKAVLLLSKYASLIALPLLFYPPLPCLRPTLTDVGLGLLTHSGAIHSYHCCLGATSFLSGASKSTTPGVVYAKRMVLGLAGAADGVDSHRSPPKKLKRRRKKSVKMRLFKRLRTSKMEGVSPHLAKYWYQRYSLFSKYDDGIKMDEEGWFSVTPEEIAISHAERSGDGSVIDCFSGVGGNAIQFARRCCHVLAIDIDPQKVELAFNNAKIYGVEDYIDFIVGDFFQLAPFLKADALFLSPPWGGPAYSTVDTFTLDMLEPKDGGANIVQIENSYLHSHLKGVTAYFGDTAWK
ncbi:hypothetical protein ACLOJK_002704 [Asimina triloba]